MWSSHAVRQVPVGRVREEELSLRCQSRFDVLLPVDVFLTAVHHPNITCEIRQTLLMYLLPVSLKALGKHAHRIYAERIGMWLDEDAADCT